MVTAKYTESTPVQPVDFTAAAGAGAEAWAKTAQEVSSDAFKRLTNLKMEEAVTQGNIEGAKGTEAQPMSGGTAYATRFNQALEQSAQIDVHTKTLDHLSQLNQEYTAKPATIANAQEYAAKGEAWVAGVIQHAPASMQGMVQNTLKPLWQSFKGQYGDYTYKQQLQSNELQQRLQMQQVINNGGLAITKGGLVDQTLTQKHYEKSQELILSKPAVSNAQKLTALEHLADTNANAFNDYFFQTTKNQLQNAVNSKNQPQIQAAQDTLNKYASDSGEIARTLKRTYPKILGNYPMVEKMVRLKGTEYRHGVQAQARQLKHEFDTALEKQKQGYKVSGEDIVNLSSAVDLVPTGKQSLEKIKDWNSFLADVDDAANQVGGYQSRLQKETNPDKIKYLTHLQHLQDTNSAAYLNRINRDHDLAQTMPLAANYLPNQQRNIKTALNDPQLGNNLLNDKYNSIDKHGILNAIDQRKLQGHALGISSVPFFTNRQAKNTVAHIQSMPTAVARGEAWNKLRTLGIAPTDVVSQVKDADPADMADAAFSNNQISDIVKNYKVIHDAARDKYKTDVDTNAANLLQNPTMISLQQAVKPKLFKTIQQAVQGIGDSLTLGNTVRGLDMDFTHVFGGYHESTLWESDRNQIIDFVLKDMGVNRSETQPLLIPQSVKGVAVNAFKVSRGANAQAKIAYKVAWTPSGDGPDWHHYLATYGFGEAPRAKVLAQYKELFTQIGEQANADNRAAYFINYSAHQYAAVSGSGVLMYYKNADGSRGNRMVGDITALEEGHL